MTQEKTNTTNSQKSTGSAATVKITTAKAMKKAVEKAKDAHTNVKEINNPITENMQRRVHVFKCSKCGKTQVVCQSY